MLVVPFLKDELLTGYAYSSKTKIVHVGREGNPRAIGDARGHVLNVLSWPHAALWERGGRGGRASKRCGEPEQIP